MLGNKVAHPKTNTKPMTSEVTPINKYLLELNIENVGVA
jgi:hypothetical protein